VSDPVPQFNEMSAAMRAPIAQCRALLRQADATVRGLDDSHRALEPQPGMKTAGWLIGHLAVTGDYARKICGRPPICPKDWRAKFNPGTHPSPDAAAYPPMAELTDTLQRVYGGLMDAATELDATALGAPNPFTPAVADFPTTGEFVAYMLTGHFAYHLGQLHAWRAAAGFPRNG
jgi:hypothetical protein